MFLEARATYVTDKANKFFYDLEKYATNDKTKDWITRLRKYFENKAPLPKLTEKQYKSITNPSKYIIEEMKNDGNKDAYYASLKDVQSLNGIKCKYLVKFLNDNPSYLTSQIPDDLTNKYKLLRETELITKYKNGYFWVQLLNKKALEYEGDNMNHCVGGDTYYHKVRDNISNIYSLRDSNNNPLITLEHDTQSNSVIQIKGKDDKIPSLRYRDLIADLINKQKIKYTEDSLETLLTSGVVFSNNKAYNSSRCPFVVDVKELNIHDGYYPIILPNIQGEILSFSNRKITSKYIYVDNIVFNNCELDLKSTVVSNYILIDNCEVNSINYIVSDKIDLKSKNDCSFCVNAEYLTLSGNNIYKIKENSVIKKIEYDNIKELIFDDYVTIGSISNKSANRCKITLGKYNKINKINISTSNSPIQELPEGLIVRELSIALYNIIPKITGKITTSILNLLIYDKITDKMIEFIKNIKVLKTIRINKEETIKEIESLITKNILNKRLKIELFSNCGVDYNLRNAVQQSSS